MRTESYTLLLVEDSPIVVEGIKAHLHTDKIDLLAPLTDTQHLEDRIAVHKPDILLINPTLLASPAKGTLLRLQRLRPQMSVVALVYHYVDPQLLAAFHATMDINIAGNKIESFLLDTVKRNHPTLPPEETDSPDLSERETDILVLVAKGLSSKEIADQLCISVHTVNTHRKNITHKTGIRSVAGLTVYAILHNLM